MAMQNHKANPLKTIIFCLQLFLVRVKYALSESQKARDEY
jgi:hypothetical protein